jgi:hypothetical protein
MQTPSLRTPSCSTLELDPLLQQYVRVGWHELKTLFKGDFRVAKEKLPFVESNSFFRRIIDFLSAARALLVEHYFECANRQIGAGNTTFQALGSTTLFSDYDLTLLGPDAPRVMMAVFHMFLEQYGNTLPIAFDTNLYCSGYYRYEGIRRAKTRLPELYRFSPTLCTFRPRTPAQMDLCEHFALLKWIEGRVPGREEYPQYDQAAVLHAELQTPPLFNAQTLRKRYDADTQTLIHRYQLQFFYGQKVSDVLYREAESALLLSHQCRSMYYSIEGYYTPCTLNVVVLKQQGKYNLNPTRFEYRCSAIENLGDFNLHFHKYRAEHTPLPDRILVLTLSKYLYRVYSALAELDHPNQAAFASLAQLIATEVLPRKTATTPAELKSIPFASLRFRGNLNEWLAYHNRRVVDALRVVRSKTNA